MTETKPFEISPFCCRLRSKKYYFLEAPARTEDELLDGSGHSWCQHTMDAVGPDGALVDPQDCQNSRRCFEGYGPRP